MQRSARRAAASLIVMLSMVGCEASGEAARTSAPITTTAVSTTSAPTPEKLAAESALQAVSEMVRVQDAARRDPAARDWEPEIRQVAGEPFASVAVGSIRTYATGGIRQVGDSTVTAEVTGVDLSAPEGPTVLLTGCFDRSESDVVRVDNGESILSPDEPVRFVWNLTVTHFESEPGGPWLVTVLEPLPEQPC